MSESDGALVMRILADVRAGRELDPADVLIVEYRAAARHREKLLRLYAKAISGAVPRLAFPPRKKP